MKKKTYEKPEMRAIVINAENILLAASGNQAADYGEGRSMFDED